MTSFNDGDHELCFDREIFFSRSFSVDQFVCEKRKSFGLEQLRHDLRSHLKYLQECLIELINEHYADFVNLSSNLVGLEKFIGNISAPLIRVQDEVSDVNVLIERLLTETSEKLSQRQKCRQLKGQTLLAIDVYRGVQKLPKGDNHSYWDLDLVERTSNQIHTLAVALERCKEIPLAAKAAEIIDQHKQNLQPVLRERFTQALENHDEVHLKNILHIGVSLDRVTFLEEFYSERFVKPALEEIVTERVLREVLSDGLFNQVVMFVTTNTAMLNRCATPEYDFILRSVFPVFVKLAEARVPTLFSLTSATMFHMRYCEAQRFLETLEQNMPNKNCVESFRASENYKRFLAKWSTGIYFQLRYTEIATNFETSLLTENDPLQFRQNALCVTEMLLKQIQCCWSENVYIESIKGKFLKLTLQLVSRYTSFLEEFSERSHPCKESSAITLFHAASDCQQMTEGKICDPFKGYLQDRERQLVKECLEDSVVRLGACAGKLSNVAVKILSELTQSYVKQIMDIPRLYRRTNREMPKTSSNYLQAMFQPIFRCKEATKLWSITWSKALAESICENFYTTTRDVLDSVRKMEDSLRRLKKGKVPELQGISDDDKIRLQIMIDVEKLGELFEELGDKPGRYGELFELAKIK